LAFQVAWIAALLLSLTQTAASSVSRSARANLISFGTSRVVSSLFVPGLAGLRGVGAYHLKLFGLRDLAADDGNGKKDERESLDDSGFHWMAPILSSSKDT
jgi:hypothetical protein